MIIEPKIRGYICTTAHPVGCAKNVQNQIDYVKAQGIVEGGPKKVLVIGASTGYGLASRITAAFGSGAATMGVFFEKASDGRKTATTGWYNSCAIDKAAHDAGLYSRSFNGDAFSDEMKAQVIEAIKKDWDGGVDMIIYSLASPRRTHPKTGEVYKSVLKPRGDAYTNKTIDFANNRIYDVTLETATQEEIDNTIQVMGGEDWSMWTDALMDAGLLAEGCINVAYTYIGPKVTQPVYRDGTIGAAKDHLENTGLELDKKMKALNGRAFVSANKALVTQSSSAIPFIPLYFVLLMKIMKAKGTHEGCIEQIVRLFKDRLYIPGKTMNDVPVDEKGIIRIDDLELRQEVQDEVDKNWALVSTDYLNEIADMDGYNSDFLALFGFGLDGVDYSADVDIEIGLPENTITA